MYEKLLKDNEVLEIDCGLGLALVRDLENNMYYVAIYDFWIEEWNYTLGYDEYSEASDKFTEWVCKRI